jgi:uncharacterized protein YndB with AHSA1/START domain
MSTEYRSKAGKRDATQTGMTSETAPRQGELLITREVAAPVSHVWQTWTDPLRIRRWWGPKDYAAPSCNIDLRVGGAYLYCMRSTDGKDIWSTGVFKEIIPLRRIVCTDSFADEMGNVVPATHYGMDAAYPRELLITVTFAEIDGKTRLTLRHTGFPSDEECKAAQMGWRESLDKFEAALKH